MKAMLEQRVCQYRRRAGLEPEPLKAILLDMDGVLFDSMPSHARAWSQAAGEFGLRITVEEAYMNEGRTGSSTISEMAMGQWGRQATGQEIRSIYERKSEIFNQFPQARPMPGALEVLEKAKRRQLRIVLVTGSGQKTLLARLSKHFPGFFCPGNMVTAFDVKYGKPSPEPYLMALEKAGVKPGQAVVVENAPLGVRAGVAAGIFTLAVNTGPLPDSALLAEGADAIMPSMDCLAANFDLLADAF